MRKFSLFAALMPSKLVEAQAEIFGIDGKHCSGDHVQLSRFGYAIQWCDGSGMAGFSVDETIETAIKDANEYLAKKGWKMGPITYTGNEITQEDIEKLTKEIRDDNTVISTYLDFLKLKMACMRQPWFDIVRQTIDGAVGVHNIKMLPKEAREYVEELIGYNQEDGITVKVGYTIDRDGHVKSYTADWKPVEEAKKILNLPETASNLDVVNALVDDIVEKYERRGDEIRKEKEVFLEKFKKAVSALDKVIRVNAGQFITTDMASLCVYGEMIREDRDWRNKSRFEKHVACDLFDIMNSEFMNFDWQTCQFGIDEGYPDSNLVTGKVKIKDDVYHKVRELFLKEFPDKVAKMDKILAKYGKSHCYGEWRNNTCDARWLHFRYGVSTMGIPVLAFSYGPETLGKCDNDEYYPPKGLENTIGWFADPCDVFPEEVEDVSEE